MGLHKENATLIDYGLLYRRAHSENPKWFSGQMDPENADTIAELVVLTGAKAIADWGSGRGYQYLVDRIHERWGVLPHCFDVGVPRLATPLEPGIWDGIICTDVMEHIAVDDVPVVLGDVFALLTCDRPTFAYFNVFCNPSAKFFPDGRNVHLSVKSPKWWKTRFYPFKRKGLYLHVDYVYTVGS